MVTVNLYLSTKRNDFIIKLANEMIKLNPDLREDRKVSRAIQHCIDEGMKLGANQLLTDYKEQVSKEKEEES